jgi:cystathionine gamma-lyase
MAKPVGAAGADPPAAGTASDATRVVRAGLPSPAQGKPFLPGPTFAAPFHLRGDPASSRWSYGRYDSPTLAAFELALTALEGGSAVAFASGMAAVAAVLLPLLEPGDAVVVPADGYPTVRTLATEHLGRRGVEIRPAPTDLEAYRRVLPGARLVWLESPSNPGLDVCDVRALAAAVHAEGGLLAVDNSLATPLGQRPLELGADLSVAADTKGLTGHGDLVLGHVAAMDPEVAEAVRAWRTVTGSLPGPFEAWLAHRSVATLDVRLERQCATALRLAEMLAQRPEVDSVRHPGLPEDPSHSVAAAQMSRFGSVVTFVLAGRREAEAFLDRARLVDEATSFGSVHTTAERRARWEGNDVPEGLIRLSVGLEDADDLVEDVLGALAVSP